MQQTISGINCIAGLANTICSKGKKILFVVGKHVLEENWFDKLIVAVSGDMKIVHPPDGLLELNDIPTVDTPDVLAAIGGGKTIDFAKVLLHHLKQPHDVFFIAVPTTAGSGSEATPFAVVYAGKEKQTIDAALLLPDAVFLDGSLLKNLSAQQRAFSAADAFSQCIESLWNINCTEAAERVALQGIEALFKGLPEFVTSENEQLNQQMLEAAHLAGEAIAITRTTGPHALSYYLTAHYNIPHGQAVALFLPLFFLYNEEKIKPIIYKALHVSNAEQAFITVKELFKKAALATSFTELGLKGIDINGLLQSVNHHRFSNNPVPYNKTYLRVLIQQHLT